MGEVDGLMGKWVRVVRSDGHQDGVLLAATPDLLAIQALGSEMSFAGVMVFAAGEIGADPYAEFHAFAPKLGWRSTVAVPTLDLGWAGVLGGIDRLVCIEMRGDSDVAWVGYPRLVADENVVVLKEVTPGGRRGETERYALDGISAVTIGGGYLDALHTVLAQREQVPG